MSLKFLLETQMVILMLCNSVLMRLLTTSALSFSVSFDCELHPYIQHDHENISLTEDFNRANDYPVCTATIALLDCW